MILLTTSDLLLRWERTNIFVRQESMMSVGSVKAQMIVPYVMKQTDMTAPVVTAAGVQTQMH